MWTSTPTSTSPSPFLMRCRNSACRPATTPRSTDKTRARWSTSSPSPAATIFTATPSNSAQRRLQRPQFFAPLNFLDNGVLTPTKEDGRDQIKRNQFGGTFGGPIIRNRTFFFFGVSIHPLPQRRKPSNSTVPTTALSTIPASGPVTSSCPTCDIETYLNTGGPGGTPAPSIRFP